MSRFLLASCLALFACNEGTVEDHAPLPQQDVSPAEELLDVAPNYRSVGHEHTGPSKSGLVGTTEVWPVSRRWYEVSDEAGIAWGANSGLTWDEKYALWLDAMVETTSDDGHTTVLITTPWGKTLAAPRVECAELAMMLRVTFAAWHELPFFMTAWSPTYGTVHYGHFGIVDSDGTRLSGYPRFRNAYEDYTDDYATKTDAWIVNHWPDDTELETRFLTTLQDDYNDFLGTDQYAGAYFDELHLNKRVGYFLLKLLPGFGSMHFADAGNLWNLEPEAMRTGDVLLHRWQAQGIGHVMVIKEVTELNGGNLDAEIVYGSMPRIQPKWYGPAISKPYFTSAYAGSAQTDSSGTPYSHLGGGLKRWRTPVVLGDNWVNIVPVADRDDYIGSTDYAALEGRIATLDGLLGQLTPTEERDAILERIELARDTLEQRPASCANRQRREEAFDELYVLMADEWGWSRAAVDAEYRIFEDYIFAELDYSQSKTCCWNSSTAAMHDIVVDYNLELALDAHANGQCAVPVTFRARNGGYEPFEGHAAALNRADEWVAWSADEACPQANVTDDVEVNTPWTPFCDIDDELVDYPADETPTGDDDDDDPIVPPVDDDEDSSGGTCSGCGANSTGAPLSLLGLGIVMGMRRRD